MILTIKDAAKFLGISERTVIRLIQQDKFPKPSGEANFGKDHSGTTMRKLRCWNEEDLEKFKAQIRPVGRPKN